MTVDTNENEDCPSCGEALGINDLEETVCLNTECDQFGIPVDNEQVSFEDTDGFEVVNDEIEDAEDDD